MSWMNNKQPHRTPRGWSVCRRSGGYATRVAWCLLIIGLTQKLVTTPCTSELAAQVPQEMTLAWEIDWSESELVRPTSIALVRDQIWVSDLATGIHRWTRSGQFIGNVGARGDGPGDYQAPVLVAPSQSGQAAVVDSRLRRVTVYTEAGQAVETVRLPEELASFATEIEDLVHLESTFFLWAVHRPRNQIRDFEDSSRLVELAESGELERVVHRVRNAYNVVRRDQLNTASVRVPFADRPTLAFLPGGRYATGSTGSPRIRTLTPRDEVAFELTLDLVRARVTPELRETALNSVHESLFGELEEQLEAGRLPPEMGAYFRDKFEDILEEVAQRIPERMPFYDKMLRGEGEVIWLLRPGTSEDPARDWVRIALQEGPTQCHLRATHLGDVVAATAGEELLVTVEILDEDVPRVAAYEVPEGAC